MKLKAIALCVVLLVSQSIGAQEKPNDPIGESFFPPELVMQHQQAIGLTDEQKEFLKAEMRKAQLKFTELQWQLQDEVEKMVALVKHDQVDEQQALAQLERVLNVEREIKRLQFSLVILIKNKLTSEQRARITEIKQKAK
ncbi:MAG TPA: periplasmic heavy metal sensor [Blastocatellia bacterium]|jgi:Spy/CpxP family protein refolding chaperone